MVVDSLVDDVDELTKTPGQVRQCCEQAQGVVSDGLSLLVLQKHVLVNHQRAHRLAVHGVLNRTSKL